VGTLGGEGFTICADYKFYSSTTAITFTDSASATCAVDVYFYYFGYLSAASKADRYCVFINSDLELRTGANSFIGFTNFVLPQHSGKYMNAYLGYSSFAGDLLTLNTNALKLNQAAAFSSLTGVTVASKWSSTAINWGFTLPIDIVMSSFAIKISTTGSFPMS
jgi:hypothetical protein